jgi:hypothetical protein
MSKCIICHDDWSEVVDPVTFAPCASRKCTGFIYCKNMLHFLSYMSTRRSLRFEHPTGRACLDQYMQLGTPHENTKCPVCRHKYVKSRNFKPYGDAYAVRRAAAKKRKANSKGKGSAVAASGGGEDDEDDDDDDDDDDDEDEDEDAQAYKRARAAELCTTDGETGAALLEQWTKTRMASRMRQENGEVSGWISG